MQKTLAILALTVCAALIGAPAAAKTCDLEISANDMIQYDKSELRIGKDCDKVKLTLTHTGKLPKTQMGHNWVLAKTSDYQAVAQAGLQAGPDKGYLPEGDGRIIVHTELIGGGESTSITFDTANLKAGGDYTFFCTFPGHVVLMNGKFVIE